MKNLFKRKKIYGGIDTIAPTHIEGWVYSEDSIIDNVALLINNKLIVEKKIDIYREDISNKFSTHKNCGFKIPLDIKINESIKKIKIIARTISKKTKELKYMTNTRSTESKIKQLIELGINGSYGVFDGIDENKEILYGWAYKKGTQKNIKVWLHCENYNPISLECNKSREDLSNTETLPNEAGFEIKLEHIPEDWKGKEVKISFDILGKYLISKSKIVVIPKGNKLSNSELICRQRENSPYINYINSESSSEFKKYWEDLEYTRIYLENIESKVNMYESKILHDKIIKSKSKKKSLIKLPWL